MLWRPITRLLRHVTKLRVGRSSIASVPPQAPREMTYLGRQPPDDNHLQPEDTAGTLRSSATGEAFGGPLTHADMNSELTDEDLMRLYLDNAAPMDYPSSSDLVGLDFDHGVSWLDWDLILQDTNAG